MLDYLYDMLPFDGLWQDMNEASNFCNGLCHQDDTLFSQKIMTRLPYMPTGASLETKAISLDVQNAQNFTQLDAHSLFGTL
jgi:alpha-glucosidase (family GH31 glycosyl hydrolase)